MPIISYIQQLCEVNTDNIFILIFEIIKLEIRVVKTFFIEQLEQKVFKFVWKHKRPQIAKAILRKTELEELGSLTSDYIKKLQ